MSITDTFALPRCPATSLRLAVGMWEFRRETDEAVITALVAAGWAVQQWFEDGGALLKYTYEERIQ